MGAIVVSFGGGVLIDTISPQHTFAVLGESYILDALKLSSPSHRSLCVVHYWNYNVVEPAQLTLTV